jgi:23S rRNA (uridine2552-2'-O)-methyltransferase
VTYRREPDGLTRRAKAEGFAARSVYKLEEIDRRVRLLRSGDSVLDLGCAPGSWLQWVAARVGAGGRVVGVDREPVRIALPANVVHVRADVEADLPLPPDPFDVVLSDLAPHTTGDRFVDEQASLSLFRRALTIAVARLRPGGAFVGKLFQGGDFPDARREVAAAFDTVRVMRPDATRRESVEVYLVGLGRK